MGIKSKAKKKVDELKHVKSKLKEGAAALAGIEHNDDEESIIQKKQDKAEGDDGKVAKRGNGFPKVGEWFFQLSEVNHRTDSVSWQGDVSRSQRFMRLI